MSYSAITCQIYSAVPASSLAWLFDYLFDYLSHRNFNFKLHSGALS